MHIRSRLVVLTLMLLAGALLAASFLLTPSKPIKLGTNLWPGYEPLYVAREQGILSSDDVALVELLSASEVMRAFRNGAIDAAALTLDEVINLRVLGLRPVIVQVTNISMGADVILAQPGITSFEELKGKRVGVEATALGAYMLSRALELNAISLDDIDVVHLEVNEHAQAFRAGQVDAVVTFDPVPQQIGEDQSVQLFDSTQIPGEIVDVLVVRERTLAERKDTIRQLISAWHEVLAFIDDNPDVSARMMSERLKVTPMEVKHSLQGLMLPDQKASLELFDGNPSPLQQQVERLAETMLRDDLIDDIPDLKGVVYGGYPDA